MPNTEYEACNGFPRNVPLRHPWPTAYFHLEIQRLPAYHSRPPTRFSSILLVLVLALRLTKEELLLSARSLIPEP